MTMTLLLGDTVPDFTAETTSGLISFHDWIGADWAFLFSHPADFTPVCTTEMGRTAQLAEDFAKRGVKPIGLSTDGVAEHLKWIEDVNDTQNTTLRFPIVADPDCKIAKLYEMIHPGQSLTAAVRSVFIIDPDKKLRLSMTYPMSVGRIRSDGKIDGADPTIAALTGAIEVRVADTALLDKATSGDPVALEFAEGNASGPAPHGTSVGAQDTAEDAGTMVSPAGMPVPTNNTNP